MFLRSIRVQDFRNLQGAIDWGKGTNVIYDNNGQGKTNWLEAVHFLAHAKSFRTRHTLKCSPTTTGSSSRKKRCCSNMAKIVQGLMKWPNLLSHGTGNSSLSALRFIGRATNTSTCFTKRSSTACLATPFLFDTFPRWKERVI